MASRRGDTATSSSRNVSLAASADNADVREAVTKATADLSTFLISLANESSLGFYRINEHAHRKVPALVRRKQEINQLTTAVTKSRASVAEAQGILQNMRKIESFGRCDEYLARIAAARGFGGVGMSREGGSGSGKKGTVKKGR